MSGSLLTAPIRLTAAAAGLAGGAALLGGGTAVRVGERALGAIPGARTSARAAAGMAVEAVGGPPHRRSSRRGARRWIEVRGLSGPDADAIADEVLAAVRAVPGVIDAVLNRSVARLVVDGGTGRARRRTCRRSSPTPSDGPAPSPRSASTR